MIDKKPTCIDPEFYKEQLPPGAEFEDARTFVIGRYVENELEPRSRQEVKLHLDRCNCCTEFLQDLENIADFQLTKNPVPYAVCPSSRMLDLFLFDRQKLPALQLAKIKSHLEECPLCKEESDWLKEMEQDKIIDLPKSRVWVQNLSVVAALFFFALSAFLIWRNTQTNMPQDQLRALAVIKEPDQIDYASLESTSPSVSVNLQQTYSQAVSLFRERKFSDASLLFEQIIGQVPDHSASLFLLGYCYYKLNEPEKAFRLCDQAERMIPHSAERCMSLVHIALKTGHFDRAVTEITSIYHQVPHEPAVRDLYHRITALTKGRNLKL